MREHASEPIVESRSSVKITLNAKRDTQWEIKAVAGEREEELDRLRKMAVAQHKALSEELL